MNSTDGPSTPKFPTSSPTTYPLQAFAPGHLGTYSENLGAEAFTPNQKALVQSLPTEVLLTLSQPRSSMNSVPARWTFPPTETVLKHFVQPTTNDRAHVLGTGTNIDSNSDNYQLNEKQPPQWDDEPWVRTPPSNKCCSSFPSWYTLDPNGFSQIAVGPEVLGIPHRQLPLSDWPQLAGPDGPISPNLNVDLLSKVVESFREPREFDSDLDFPITCTNPQEPNGTDTRQPDCTLNTQLGWPTTTGFSITEILRNRRPRKYPKCRKSRVRSMGGEYFACDTPGCTSGPYKKRDSLRRHQHSSHISPYEYLAVCCFPGCRSILKSGTEKIALSNLTTHQRAKHPKEFNDKSQDEKCQVVAILKVLSI